MTNFVTRAFKEYIWEPIKDAWAMAKENPLAVAISIFGAEFGIPPMWVPAVAAGANTAVKGGSPQDILKSAMTAQAMAYVGRMAGGSVAEAATKAGFSPTQVSVIAGGSVGAFAAITGAAITGTPINSKTIMSGLVLGGISAGIPKLMAPGEAASMVSEDILAKASQSSDPIGYINKAMDWTPGLGTTTAAYTALENYNSNLAMEVAQQHIQNFADLGIDQSQIAGLESLGYDSSTIQDLINAGADVNVITDAANLNIDANQLSSLTTTQFDPQDIVDMIQHGNSIEDITMASDLVDQGKLSIDNAKTIVEQGYNTIDMAQFDNLDQVAQLTNQGVSKYTIDTLNSHGYDLDQVNSLIENGNLDVSTLNNSGPNAGKVVYETLNPQYSGTITDQIARTGLVNPTDANILASNGYTASQVQSLVNAGYGISDIVDLASTGVSANTLQSLSNSQFSEYQINDMLRNNIGAGDIASANNLILAGKLDVNGAANLLDAGYTGLSLNRLATNNLTNQAIELVDRGLTKNSIDTLINNGYDLTRVNTALDNGWTNSTDINTNVAKSGYKEWLTTSLSPPAPVETAPTGPIEPKQLTFLEQNPTYTQDANNMAKMLLDSGQVTEQQIIAAYQGNPTGDWLSDLINNTNQQPVQPTNTIPVQLADGSVGQYDPTTGNVTNSQGQIVAGNETSPVTPSSPTDVAGPYRVDISGQPATDLMTPLQRQEYLKAPIPEGTNLANQNTPGAYYDITSNAWVVKATPTEITQPIIPEVIPTDTTPITNVNVESDIIQKLTDAGLTQQQIDALGTPAWANMLVDLLGPQETINRANALIIENGGTIATPQTPTIPVTPEVPTTPPATTGTTTTGTTTPTEEPIVPINPPTTIGTGTTTGTGTIGTGITNQPTGPITPVVEPPLTPLPPVDVNPLPPVAPPVEVIPPTEPIPNVDVTTPEEPVTPEPTPTLPEIPTIPYIPPTPTTPSTDTSYTLNWGTPIVPNIPTTLNPGWITNVPQYYQPTGQAGSKYYWGQHPTQPGPTFNPVLYNQLPNAPATPFGVQNAQAAATPEQIMQAMGLYYPLMGSVNAPIKPT